MTTTTNKLLIDYRNNKRLIDLIVFFSLLLTILILVGTKISDTISDSQSSDPVIENRLYFYGSGFPTLQLGHYALWLQSVDNEDWIFAKRFNSVDNRLISLDQTDLVFIVSPLEFDSLRFAKITIEPEADRDEIPYNLTIAEGIKSESNIEFNLTISNLEGANGEYFLATPTDGNNNINETAGVWFYNKNEDFFTLSLPENGTTWQWQARVRNTTDLIDFNIGNFNHTGGKDDFSRFQDNSLLQYPAPGEDFFANLPDNKPLLNLANGNYQLVVSLEPSLNGTDPSGEDVFLPVLQANISEQAPSGEPIPLENIYQPIQLTLTANETAN